MSINDRDQPRYKTRNEEIVAQLREAAGAGPPIDQKMQVKRKAAEIAVAMALLHGGDWRAEVDHQTGFVLIAPQLPQIG